MKNSPPDGKLRYLMGFFHYGFLSEFSLELEILIYINYAKKNNVIANTLKFKLP